MKVQGGQEGQARIFSFISPCPSAPLLPHLPLLLFKAYTLGECATLVLWFRVELATKLNKIANGV